jgi:hypothetical protein
MPIRAFLDGHSFDGETIRLMGIAFETGLASLGYTLGSDDPIRAALARKIIVLAEAGERDPERLCDAALKALRAAINAPNPPQPPASPQALPDS